MGKCVYTLSDKKALYPRVAYNTECGIESVEMRGYVEDKFCNPTQELRCLTGKCMKCQREIEFNPPSNEVVSKKELSEALTTDTQQTKVTISQLYDRWLLENSVCGQVRSYVKDFVAWAERQ